MNTTGLMRLLLLELEKATEFGLLTVFEHRQSHTWPDHFISVCSADVKWRTWGCPCCLRLWLKFFLPFIIHVPATFPVPARRWRGFRLVLNSYATNSWLWATGGDSGSGLAEQSRSTCIWFRGKSTGLFSWSTVSFTITSRVLGELAELQRTRGFTVNLNVPVEISGYSACLLKSIWILPQCLKIIPPRLDGIPAAPL